MKKNVRLSKNEEILIKIPHLKKQLLITANDDNYEIISSEDGEEYKIMCESCDFANFEKYVGYKLLVKLLNTMDMTGKELEKFSKVIDEMFYTIHGENYDDIYSKVKVETNFLIEKC